MQHYGKPVGGNGADIVTFSVQDNRSQFESMETDLYSDPVNMYPPHGSPEGMLQPHANNTNNTFAPQGKDYFLFVYFAIR